MWSYEQLEGLIDKEAVIEFKKNALNPEHGSMMGSAQNPDVGNGSRRNMKYSRELLPGNLIYIRNHKKRRPATKYMQICRQ